MASLESYVKDTKNYLRSLPRPKLYTYLFMFVLVLGGSIIALSFMQKESYAPLFWGLNVEDASVIVAKLKEQKIPYKLEANGTAIYVPKEKLYDVKLFLASQNAIPGSGGVGFELFDKSSYGMTEFMQNINYKRAIQGELQRTINQMPEIKASRVHIAFPEKSLFSEKEKETTASVFVKLKPGRVLSKEAILSIVHLVASSVEGLKPENVVVVDAQGKILYKGLNSRDPTYAASAHFEIQKEIERKIEESLQSMLDRFLNHGKSIVRVSVDLNFRKVERLEEEYQPNKVVLTSEKKLKEKSSNKSLSPGGVPGVKSNLKKNEEATEKDSDKYQLSEREESESTYEVSKAVKRIVEPYGEIKRISVAVVVDGKYEVVKGEKGEEIKYIPRTEKEIEDIRKLVAMAVGFNEERGDKIEVINMPFETEAFFDEKAWMEKEERKELIFNLVRYGFYFIVALFFLFFVVRPIIRIFWGEKGEKTFAQKIVGETELKPTFETPSLSDGKQKFLVEKTVDKEAIQAVIKEWLRESA